MNQASLSLIVKNVRLYRSLEEYTDDLSYSTFHANIELENLEMAFEFFFLVLGCILIVFVIGQHLPKGKRLLKMAHLKMRFVRFFVIQQYSTMQALLKLRFSRLKRTAGQLTICVARWMRKIFAAKRTNGRSAYSAPLE